MIVGRINYRAKRFRATESISCLPIYTAMTPNLTELPYARFHSQQYWTLCD